MPDKTKAPTLASNPGLSETLQTNHITRPPIKWKRVLAALVSGKSFNRFEAERELHDHCLHSTVATIQSKGVVIYRCDETVPGFQRIPTHVCRYWLAPESRLCAMELLAEASPSRSSEIAA